MMPEKQTLENGQNGHDEAGRFARGNAGGPGRPRGEPNKLNAALKDDILTAYRERGGIEWLRGLSDALFSRLLEKIMPREIAAEVRASVRWEEEAASLTDQESREYYARCIATLDGTGFLAEVEANLARADADALRAKLPALDKLIAESRQEGEEAAAKISRAEALKARIALGAA